MNVSDQSIRTRTRRRLDTCQKPSHLKGRNRRVSRLVNAMNEITIDTELRAWFTEESLATWLRISDRKVRQWVAEGRLPSYKLDGCRRFHPDDVASFLAQFRDARSVAA
jgi:excisionase family DNA binding protein